ncbi:MAG: TrmH family RNA methyltransferase [bacterium]|nr:TrmH family RNA methyltransferase [bacterium]
MNHELKERFREQRREERRARRRAEYRAGLRPAAVAAWEITKEHNMGGLVRTAHAAALEEVVFAGTRDWNVEAAKTSELYTSVTQVGDAAALLEHCRQRSWTLVAVELDPRSVSVFDATYPSRPCFLLGAELHGLPEELLDASELIVQIPQWGLVPSLNLAIAGSIVIYDFLAKLKRAGKLNRPDGGLVEGIPEPQGT